MVLCLGAGCGDDDNGTPAIDSGAGGPDGMGGGGDGGPTADAPPGTPDSAVPTVDAGPGGSVSCGAGTCDPSTQVCCVDTTMTPPTSTCIAIGDTCAGATASCDGPEDCDPGAVCCAHGGAGTFEAGCAGMCSGGGFVLCHDAATDCGTGEMCCVDATTGYGVCLAVPVCP